MKKLTVNATPDKSLIQKLGRTGYKTNQAIAELVDNAIDARLDGITERIEIKLDSSRGEIVIWDNGRGMNVNELESAWTIARSSDSKGRIGKFGMGLKSAASTLGGLVVIKTKKGGEDQELSLTYDEERWITDKNASWDKIDVESYNADKSKHGTQIVISRLKVSLYFMLTKNLLKDFGIRYEPYIKKQIVQISINEHVCQAIEPEIEDDTREEINIVTIDDTRIHGWIALLKQRSIKGNYGIHLYANERLIKPYAKFGIRQHPSVARIIGSISLENIPVNVFKTEFITESEKYKIAEKIFKSDPMVKKVVRLSHTRTLREHDIDAIMNSTEEQKGLRLLQIGDEESQKLLESVDEIPIKTKAGKMIIRLEDDETGVYRLIKRGDVPEIVVNRQSSVFRAFRNPLIFLLMLRVETETFPQEMQIGEHIHERNMLWETHMANKISRKQSNGQARNRKRLENSLTDLYEHLEDFPYKFQFTALSTLGIYLHNAYKKIVYTVYTIKGAGDQLERAIRRYGKFAVLRDPTEIQFSTAFQLAGGKNIIVIREYSKVSNSKIATLEKSWVDLYFEIENKGMIQYKDELGMIKELIEDKYADKKKVIGWAKQRKIGAAVKEYMRESP